MRPNYARVFDTSTSEIESDASEMQMIKNKLVKAPVRVKPVQRGEKAITADMIKSFFIYYPETEIPDLSAYNNCHIGIYIEKDYFFPQNNKNLFMKKLWGTEFYHYKSDIVLMLFHCGRVGIESLKNPKIKGFQLICQVSKRKNFKESTANGITSQKLSGQDKDGFTLKPVQLDPLESFKARNLLFHADRLQFSSKRITKALPRYLKPHNSLSLYCCKFNKLNDLSIQFTFQNICDKSSKKEEFLSYLLEDYSMVIESIFGHKIVIQFKRVSVEVGSGNNIFYSISEVLDPRSNDRENLQKWMAQDESKVLKIIEDDVKWEEILWDQHKLSVRGKDFSGLDNIVFIPRNELQIDGENQMD